MSEGLRLSALGSGKGVLVECSLEAPAEITLSDVVDQYAHDLLTCGYSYGQQRHDLLVRTFITSLCTKRFVILTGLSGSGKTKIAQNFGHWLGTDNLQIVAVRPDWTNPDPLLGYEDGLSELKNGGRAWHVPTALQFILRAINAPDQPFLLLLDEMNLAHVERYFADVLSGMESGHPVVPNLVELDGEWRLADPNQPHVPLPANLFIVGTVNVDETTYMFSPKVLDRANTIEFRVSTDDLSASTTPPTRIAVASHAHSSAFLRAATASADGTPFGDQVGTWLVTLHRELSAFGREFGHRTYSEAIRFANLLAAAGETDANVAFDLQVLQKLLPRYHGSIRELSEALNTLAARCYAGPNAQTLTPDFDPIAQDNTGAALPLSYDKVRRMASRLRANHFVSFAE